MPMMALIPPLFASFILLFATDRAIWKGCLIGMFASVLSLPLFRTELFALVHWRGRDLPADFLGWCIELCYISFFFKIAGFPLIGGCVEAIHKGFVSVGIFSLLAAFSYYFVLVFTHIWLVFTS